MKSLLLLNLLPIDFSRCDEIIRGLVQPVDFDESIKNLRSLVRINGELYHRESIECFKNVSGPMKIENDLQSITEGM